MEGNTFIYPHHLLIKEYLKIAEKEKSLLDFYYRSIQLFDDLFMKSHLNFADFINGKEQPISGRYAWIILQIKSAIDSFFGHYFILNNGLCNASIPNLRFCYETLLKNYFYLTLPNGEKDLVKIHKTKPNKIRGKIYSVKSLNSHNKLYQMLSTKSHAGIISSSPSATPSPEMYKDSIETGLYLLHGHFIFFLECFNQFISQEYRSKIKMFFGEFANTFDNTSSAFIPDKEEINSLLKFKNVDLVTPESVDSFVRDKQEYLDNS